MNAIYNTVIQELLVQQHIIRYNTKYEYDEVCWQTTLCQDQPA